MSIRSSLSGKAADHERPGGYSRAPERFTVVVTQP
jgi:hypothetical protein